MTTKTAEVSENTAPVELTTKDIVTRAALGALVGVVVNVVATSLINKAKAVHQARKTAALEVTNTK